MSSPKQTHPTQPELVPVDTALTVLSEVDLLRESNSLALDIGGSLAKLIYLQPHTPNHPTPKPLKVHLVDGTVATALSVHVPALRGTLHFFAFETRNIHQLLRFIRRHWAHHTTRRHIRATGGGAYKYAATFQAEIDVTLARLDEMRCTVAGLNFLLTSVRDEVYAPAAARDRAPHPPEHIPRAFLPTNHHPFPYLLVNIGSGVSIVKVTGHDRFERVSGSSLGGGTFWGLARMLLDCATFDDVIELTHAGDNANVDMLVGDIYGRSYDALGLDATVIAASFGKATMRDDYIRHPVSALSVMRDRFIRACVGSYHLWMSFLRAVPAVSYIMRKLSIADDADRPPALITHTGARFRPQDVALALLRMVSYNIGQIAYLNARVHNLDRIYFGGNFIRNHPYTLADISYAVDFWSGGKTKALFLRHDGYLGAIGAFINASSASPRTAMDLNGDTDRHPPKPDTMSNGPTKSVGADQPPDEKLAGDISTLPILNDTAKGAEWQDAAEVTANGSSKSRRRKKKSSRGSNEAVDAIYPHQNDQQNASLPEENIPNQHVDPEGDWTTVTRLRRKPVAKDKAA